MRKDRTKITHIMTDEGLKELPKQNWEEIIDKIKKGALSKRDSGYCGGCEEYKQGIYLLVYEFNKLLAQQREANNQFYYNRGYLDAREELIKEIKKMKIGVKPQTCKYVQKKHGWIYQAGCDHSIDEIIKRLTQE